MASKISQAVFTKETLKMQGDKEERVCARVCDIYAFRARLPACGSSCNWVPTIPGGTSFSHLLGILLSSLRSHEKPSEGYSMAVRAVLCMPVYTHLKPSIWPRMKTGGFT